MYHDVLLPLFYVAGFSWLIFHKHFAFMHISELDLNFVLFILSLFVLVLVFDMLTLKYK